MERLAEAAARDQAGARGVEEVDAGARRAEDGGGAVDGALKLLLERQRVRQLTRELGSAGVAGVHTSPARLYVAGDGTARIFRCEEGAG
jgi:hypothetical protein